MSDTANGARGTTSLGRLADAGLSPEPALAVELARHARRLGERQQALHLLVRAAQGGGWRRGTIWAELVAMMESADDYQRIRELWLASPPECHRSISVLRSVARATCLAGEHEVGRALLRKAILQHARQQQQLAERARRSLRPGTSSARGALKPKPVAGPSFEERAGAAMRDLDDVLQRTAGVRSFLVAGTLLGLVRDGNVIPWDMDVDVGVFRNDVDVEVVREALNRDRRFTVRRLDLTTDRLRVRHDNGAQIDVFPHYVEAGRLWHDGAATRWWNTPFDLEEVEFLGVPQLVPADRERYLHESYGDWRTPDPHFEARLDAPNVEITDQAYFDSLLYFGLLHALVKDKPRKRDRYVRLVRSTGTAAWLDRI